MSKAHLLHSLEPVPAGGKYLFPCGAQIERAEYAFLWDETAMGTVESEHLPTKGVCTKCRNRIGDLPIDGKRYFIYGMVEGKKDSGAL